MKSKDGTTRIREFAFKIDGRRTTVGVIVDDSCGKWFALGWQFGPTLFVKAECEATALHVFDEHCGERVDAEDPALLDYEPTAQQLKEAGGNEARARYFAALDSGDVRINDGGTIVWSDPYEWMREVEPSAVRRKMSRWRR